MKMSERLGIVEPRRVIQKESVDLPLRNKLWDIVKTYLLQSNEAWDVKDVRFRGNYRLIWTEFLERAADEVPQMCITANAELRELFFGSDWYFPYELIEMLVAGGTEVSAEQTQSRTNEVLERYMSAYRMIDGQFVPIVDEAEIKSIEDAIATPLHGVRTHLSKALTYLADREQPDPANSIKESISAVESLCSAVVGKRATLADAMKQLEGAGIVLHPALVKGWSAIYGYTSDAGGVRHAMQDDAEPDIEHALYMVVACSAFVNLVVSLAGSAGVTLVPVAR